MATESVPWLSPARYATAEAPVRAATMAPPML